MPPEHVLPLERIRAPLVEYQTAWHRGVGFLVGDRRTVVVLGNLRDRYRRITVRMAEAGGEWIDVERVELTTQEETSFVVLHLTADLPGTPLEVSPVRPEIGDEVYLILRRGRVRRGDAPQAMEPAVARVTASSASTFTVGTASSQLWDGSPLFDAQGRVVGFFGSRNFALRSSQVLADSGRRDRELVTPIIGLRVGTELQGLLDDPFALDIEAGVALWDQLGLVLRLGFAFSDEVQLLLPASSVRETGIVDGNQRTINLGLEVKYRLLLTRAAMPLYFDFVAGAQYTAFITEPRGVALYSTEPGCDPLIEGCDLSVGPTPGRNTEHGVGGVIGIDVRAGVFTMGYRVVIDALAYNLPTTHRITFGVTYR